MSPTSDGVSMHSFHTVIILFLVNRVYNDIQELAEEHKKENESKDIETTNQVF
jgi:hypothetical protein